MSTKLVLLDSTGATVVKYVYDAWGNQKVLNPNGTVNTVATFIGHINPIRYRSYYYDIETGLYYLQSRYYDPQTGRFISMDDISYLDPETIGGANLFAYCNDNPVMYVDPMGKFAISAAAIIVGALVGLAVGLGTVAYKDYKSDGQLFNENNTDYLFYGLIGAITGAIGGVFSEAAFVVQLAVSATVGATTSIAEGFYIGEITEFMSLKTLQFGVSGALTSSLSFLFASGITQVATKLKYNSIIGNNTSNHHINQALSKAGFGDLKIGKDGIQEILNAISKTYPIKFIEHFSNSIFNFVTGAV